MWRKGEEEKVRLTFRLESIANAKSTTGKVQGRRRLDKIRNVGRDDVNGMAHEEGKGDSQRGTPGKKTYLRSKNTSKLFEGGGYP